jgi:protein-S-isoprenylcysteine O-methyltransferase Ste14
MVLGWEMGLTLRKMDLGRLAIIPAFTFLLTLNSLAVYKNLKGLDPINLIQAVGFIHHLLIVCFYILLILLYFLRTSAISTSKSPVVNTIAIVTTFLPFSIPLIGKNSVVDPLRASISSVIIIVGMLLSVFALSILGRNVSIIPQARKLVKTGPYRVVRHPLYLGELISVFGIAVGEMTMPRISVFLLFMVAQIYRSLREEKLLGNIFPDYQEYCSRTPRFIPGLF